MLSKCSNKIKDNHFSKQNRNNGVNLSSNNKVNLNGVEIKMVDKIISSPKAMLAAPHSQPNSNIYQKLSLSEKTQHTLTSSCTIHLRKLRDSLKLPNVGSLAKTETNKSWKPF